jgi:hypothetical protein
MCARLRLVKVPKPELLVENNGGRFLGGDDYDLPPNSFHEVYL